MILEARRTENGERELPGSRYYTSQVALRYVKLGAILGTSTWVLASLWRFGTVAAGLTDMAAAMWAIVVFVVSAVCFGTVVGVVVWPFVVGFLSNLFGAPPAAWRDAALTTLFVGILVAIAVGMVVGAGLGFIVYFALPRRVRVRRAIGLALQQDNVEVVEELMARLPVSKAEARGAETLLMTASRQGAVESVRLLLDRGADIEAVDHDGSTALFYGAASGRLPVVELLVQRGADVGHANRFDVAPSSGIGATREIRGFLSETAKGRALGSRD